MALYVLFKNKNTLLFIYIFCLLFNLQMCQIILTDPVLHIYTVRHKKVDISYTVDFAHKELKCQNRGDLV